MPIYEYACKECGHEFDVLQKISDRPLKDCPECKKPALRKLVSAPSFRLKGAGWYETDFKSDKEKKRNLAGEGANGSDKGKKTDDKKVDSSPKADKPAAGKGAPNV